MVYNQTILQNNQKVLINDEKLTYTNFTINKYQIKNYILSFFLDFLLSCLYFSVFIQKKIVSIFMEIASIILIYYKIKILHFNRHIKQVTIYGMLGIPF